MAEQNYHPELKRIADALEALVRLSTPPRTSPMVKKQPPLYPYTDAPTVRGHYYGMDVVSKANVGFIDSEPVD